MCQLLWCILSPAEGLCPWELLVAYCLCGRCTSWGKEKEKRAGGLGSQAQQAQKASLLHLRNSILVSLIKRQVMKTHHWTAWHVCLGICLISPFLMTSRHISTENSSKIHRLHRGLKRRQLLFNFCVRKNYRLEAFLIVVYKAALASRPNGLRGPLFIYLFTAIGLFGDKEVRHCTGPHSVAMSRQTVSVKEQSGGPPRPRPLFVQPCVCWTHRTIPL